MGIKKVISLPNSTHTPISKLNLNLPEPSLHLRIPAPRGPNMGWALFGLPSMVSEGATREESWAGASWLAGAALRGRRGEGRSRKGDGNVTLLTLPGSQMLAVESITWGLSLPSCVYMCMWGAYNLSPNTFLNLGLSQGLPPPQSSWLPFHSRLIFFRAPAG